MAEIERVEKTPMNDPNVKLMNDGVIDRLKDERSELATRLQNLRGFLSDQTLLTQTNISAAEVNLMWHQNAAMGQYLDILIERIRLIEARLGIKRGA